MTSGGLVYHVLNRSVAGLPLFRKRAEYEAFERIRTCIARSRPYRRGCERMGLAPSENPENLGKSVVAKVPVPILSQPRSEEWQDRQAEDQGLWHTLRREGRPSKQTANQKD